MLMRARICIGCSSRALVGPRHPGGHVASIIYWSRLVTTPLLAAARNCKDVPSMTQAEKGRAFRALHEGEPFLIPNPYDAGSAKVLAGLGFKALATTSGGFAFTLGRLDGAVTLEEVAAHIRTLDGATS